MRRIGPSFVLLMLLLLAPAWARAQGAELAFDLARAEQAASRLSAAWSADLAGRSTVEILSVLRARDAGLFASENVSDLFLAAQSSYAESLGLPDGALRLLRSQAFRNAWVSTQPTRFEALTECRVGLCAVGALSQSLHEAGAVALQSAAPLDYTAALAGEAERADLMRRIYAELRVRSQYLNDTLTEQEKWDTIIVGAGPHGVSVANAIKSANPEARVLVLEATEYVAPTFRHGGHTYSMLDWLNVDEVRRLADGELPEVHDKLIVGPIQPTEIDGTLEMTGSAVWQATAISLHDSHADAVFGVRVDSIAEGVGGTQVMLQDGRSVFGDRVVIATGYGTRAEPASLDEASRRYLREQLASFDESNPSHVPLVMTVDQARRLADLSGDVLGPYTSEPPAIAPVTGVVGGNGGGRTFVKFITGIGPIEAYAGTPLLQRQFGQVEWITGWSGAGSVEELRTRRPGLDVELNARVAGGQVGLHPGHITHIEPVTTLGRTRVRVTVRSPDGEPTTILLDHLVLANNLVSPVDSMLSPLLEEGHALVPVTASAEEQAALGIYGDSVALGQRVAGTEVYVAGPAAGVDLIKPEELPSIVRNPGALVSWIPRTEVLAHFRLAPAP